MFARIRLWSHLVLGVFFVCMRFFCYILNFYFYWSVSSNYLFLLDSVLVDWIFLESPFLPGCQICWHVIVHSILLWFFVFLQYQLKFLFNFLFCLFWFYFLLGEPGQWFVNFVNPLKNQLLVLLFFSFSFWISILLICFLIFIISFLLLTLGLVCSYFSNSFRC